MHKYSREIKTGKWAHLPKWSISFRSFTKTKSNSVKEASVFCELEKQLKLPRAQSVNAFCIDVMRCSNEGSNEHMKERLIVDLPTTIRSDNCKLWDHELKNCLMKVTQRTDTFLDRGNMNKLKRCKCYHEWRELISVCPAKIPVAAENDYKETFGSQKKSADQKRFDLKRWYETTRSA